MFIRWFVPFLLFCKPFISLVDENVKSETLSLKTRIFFYFKYKN